MTTSRTTFFTFLYKIALSALGFVNSVLAARYLSQVDRVDFQYAGTVANAGMTTVGGYTGYYSYALSKQPGEAEEIVRMGNLFIFTICLLVWLAAAAARWAGFPAARTPWLHIAWWGLACMPFNFLIGYGTRILQGTNRIRWLNRANIAQAVLFLLMYLPLFFDRSVPHRQRLSLTYAVWLASFGAAALFTMAAAYRTLGLRRPLWPSFSRRHWSGTFRYGGWLSLSNLVNIVNYRMDFWLVGVLAPHKAASVYGIAVTASEVLLGISGSVASVVYTRMTGGSRQDAIRLTELAARHTLISSAIVALGMYLVFPALIVLAFGHRYAGAIPPFFILLPGLVVKAASNIVIQYSTNQLGNPRTSIWINGVSAATNGLCCLLLIPSWGLTGAATASTISYAATYAVCVVWFSRAGGVSPTGLFWVRRADLAPYAAIVLKGWHLLVRPRG
ncbi:MAG: polysaccharide biosynthesis C-terminal domain-containing protein [Alicyclobacillus sp.]|nr:polysaccharide biosynthesis C-terminal domain-containing protein [Alicyclobacillus sp.]